jgi:glutaminyl-tRNA synthetase
MRKLPFSKYLYIEQEDFMENPPPKFFRLTPGNEVRLKYAYIVKCTGVLKDDNGNIREVHCTYDPETRSGLPQSNRKVKGTIHWVSAGNAIPAEVRLYEQLFLKENPEEAAEGEDFKNNINPNSLQVKTCIIEASAENAKSGEKYQFERLGYFCVDPDSKIEKLIFNRTLTLKDSWAKMQK